MPRQYAIRAGNAGPVVEGNSNGDVLIWDAALRKWIPGPVVGGSTGLISDTFTASGEGDINEFQLSAVPVNESGVIVFANGTQYGQDFWSLVDDLLTWTSDDPSMVEGWQVVVFYQPTP
jgi:hypothetical protein